MIAIMLAPGFEEIEALAPCDLLRRAGLETVLVGVGGPVVTGSHRITVQADMELKELSAEQLEMLVLPGGLRGVQSLLASDEALQLTKHAWDDGKFVCAICAAPTILARLGITDGREAVCYPGKEPEMGEAVMVNESVVRSGRLITGRAAGSAIDFALTLVEVLKGREEAQRISAQIVYGS